MVIAQVTLLTAFLAATPAHAQRDSTSHVCDSEYSSASTTSGSLALPNGTPFDIRRAMALFRFNRQMEALQELNAALSLVKGPWRWRVPADRVKELKADLNALRGCLARHEPPAMATLTIDAFLVVNPETGEQARLPVAGATVKVEDIPVGRTAGDGTLTVRVPSGAIRVATELAPSTWGEGYVTLPPGGSERLSVPLDDGKEVTEDTDLVVAEVVDDIIPVTSPSFTLKFMRGDRLAPVVNLGRIELLDRDGNFERNLEELFAVVNGVVTTNRTAELFDSLAGHAGETITLLVDAEDAADRTHHDRVRFRLGLSRLVVTLSPPPSNPTLSVSNIEVGVSLIGAGIAVQRVSDAQGRFEVEAFPHGTVTLDCETVSGGFYYYCHGTMAHWGEQSVILVPLHVSDLVKGVPPLTLQPNAAPAPHVERRKPGR